MLGPEFEIRNHIEKVIVVVVILSISPGLIAWWRAKRKKPEPIREFKRGLKALRQLLDFFFQLF